MHPLPPRLAAVPLLVAATAAAACALTEVPDEDITAPTYVVDRTSSSEGATVAIVSGSVWSGPASLVETLAIGEETGTDAYMFGSISGAWATDESIYVIDSQLPAVRAYDRQGRHRADIGNAGQGPGEYVEPSGIAVKDDGTIVIADAITARVSLFDPSGELLETWPSRSPKSALGLTLLTDGSLYTRAWNGEASRMAMQSVGPAGTDDAPRFPPVLDFAPPQLSLGKGMAMVLPFAARAVWTMAAGGEIVAGVGDGYEFQVHGRAGGVTRVRRYWEPVPVHPEEAEYRAELASRALRDMAPGLAIRAADLPAHKPAFDGFHADRVGRLWVIRQGVGQPDPACVGAAADAIPRLIMTTEGENVEMAGKPGAPQDGISTLPCWIDTVQFDLFDLGTGDYLGTAPAPEPGFRLLFANAEIILAAVIDDGGTERLKGYTLENG